MNEQTSIIGKEEVNIRTEKNTHVEGAVIAAENGNLKLDTDTLTYKDIHDHDKAENFQVNLSASYSNEAEKKMEAEEAELRQAGKIKEADKVLAKLKKHKKTNPDGTPVSKTLDGNYGSKDRRQINRATIGEGEIIIRSDPDAGLEGLNRDLEKAQEITKDEKTSVTVYVDKAAAKEVLNGGKGIVEGFEKTSERIQQLANEFQAITASLPPEMKHLGDAGLVAMQDMIRADVPDEAIAELMNDEQFQSILTKAADLSESLKTYDVDSAVNSKNLSVADNGPLQVIISAKTPIREQLLNLLSATKQYIDAIPYKEEAQLVLLGLQTALGGPVKTAVSVISDTVVESIVGEKVEQIKTEAATEIAARLRYKGSSEEVLSYNPDGFDEDIDASKFGLNLLIGSTGAIIGGKAILGNKGLGSSSRIKLSYDKNAGTWKTPAGLVYGEDRKFGNRIKHVLAHGEPDPTKTTHSVFNVEKHEILGLIDEAWRIKNGTGVPQGNRTKFVVDMGRVVGTNGQHKIRIIVEGNKIITAFPE